MIDEETDLPIDTTEPKYPQIQITADLDSPEGNAFVLIGKVRRELEKLDVSEEEVEEFDKEAKSGDYENVLATVSKWVDFNYWRFSRNGAELPF